MKNPDPPNTQEMSSKRKRVNVRRPEVMALVQAEVEQHYRSLIVEKLRAHGGELTIGGVVGPFEGGVIA